jgi:hypothetical protein
MQAIASHKQLLLDERFVQQPRNMALTVNPPTKAGRVYVSSGARAQLRLTVGG